MLIMILILAQFVMVAAGLGIKHSDNTPTEPFLFITTCNYTHVPINCGTRSTICIHSVQYGYREGCERICCSYNASDCIVHDNKSKNLHNIQQECSEKRSCNVSLDGKQSLCSTINAVASYIVMQYSCPSSDSKAIANNKANIVLIAAALTSSIVAIVAIGCLVVFLVVRFKRRHRMRTGAFNSPSISQSCSNTENHPLLEGMGSNEQLLEKGEYYAEDNGLTV
ncbi:uncharacterized protein LOC128546013 [Mercenaria mercenaria]|uniref:uncharacterized protein LOC128546013 n=1 Tax=Mercenaria mercenaria TaxID=6596 RepID=UPI00234E98B2|nr:uncharacterized protein LOC128546013 [Mercenaria mercenaria]